VKTALTILYEPADFKRKVRRDGKDKFGLSGRVEFDPRGTLCKIDEHHNTRYGERRLTEWRSWMGRSMALGLGKSSRVIEPELDMNRGSTRVPAGFFRLLDRLRSLVPAARMTGPPMRSVGRELEELWPSRDR
jgi:hypothetical protein